jgi:hypothetical protein
VGTYQLSIMASSTDVRQAPTTSMAFAPPLLTCSTAADDTEEADDIRRRRSITAETMRLRLIDYRSGTKLPLTVAVEPVELFSNVGMQEAARPGRSAEHGRQAARSDGPARTAVALDPAQCRHRRRLIH